MKNLRASLSPFFSEWKRRTNTVSRDIRRSFPEKINNPDKQMMGWNSFVLNQRPNRKDPKGYQKTCTTKKRSLGSTMKTLHWMQQNRQWLGFPILMLTLWTLNIGSERYFIVRCKTNISASQPLYHAVEHVTALVIRNRIDNPRSNPRPGSLCFTFVAMLASVCSPSLVLG